MKRHIGSGGGSPFLYIYGCWRLGSTIHEENSSTEVDFVDVALKPDSMSCGLIRLTLAFFPGIWVSLLFAHCTVLTNSNLTVNKYFLSLLEMYELSIFLEFVRNLSFNKHFFIINCIFFMLHLWSWFLFKNEMKQNIVYMVCIYYRHSMQLASLKKLN